MPDLITLRRHRFDALHDLLTGASAERPRRPQLSPAQHGLLCATVLLTAGAAVIGLVTS